MNDRIYLNNFAFQGSEGLRGRLKADFKVRFDPEKKNWYVTSNDVAVKANAVIEEWSNLPENRKCYLRDFPINDSVGDEIRQYIKEEYSARFNGSKWYVIGVKNAEQANKDITDILSGKLDPIP